MNKKLLIISFGRLTQMLLLFATVRVLSKVFTVDEMGNYYFLLSIAAAYGLIWANPIGMYVNRKIHEWHNNGVLKKNLYKINLLYIVGALLLIPILIIFRSKLNSETSVLVASSILITFIFSTTVNNTLIPALNLLGESFKFVILTNLTNILGLVISYVFVTTILHDPYMWLLGQAISFLVLSVIAMLFISKMNLKTSKEIDSNFNLNELLKFGVPVAFTNVFVWGMSQSFRFFLKDNIDSDYFGKMVFGFGLATSLCVAVEYLFQQLYLPKFYNDLNETSEKKQIAWNVYLNKVVPSYLALILFIIGLSPFLMKLLADLKFKDSFKFLAVGAIIEFLRMLGNVFNMAMHANMNTKKSVVPYVLGGSFTILTILFIGHNPKYASWIALSLAGGHLLSSIILKNEVNKIFKINFDFSNFFKVACLAFVLLIPILINSEDKNALYSMTIIFPFGLVLLGIFYWQFKKHEDA